MTSVQKIARKDTNYISFLKNKKFGPFSLISYLCIMLLSVLKSAVGQLTGTPLKIAVALSGGNDSSALLHSLATLRCELLSQRQPGFSIIALHCNFHLRGEESVRDTRFAVETAQKTGVEIFVAHFIDTDKEASENGESIEMTCRRLRYDWFSEFSRQGYWIALAHHADDNHETLFLNLLRGTGIRGLRGMTTVDTHRKLFRPFLSLSRKDIENYNREHQLSWMNDSTNLIPDVKRNRLRINIIPEIAGNFPNYRRGLDTTMRNARRDSELMEEYLSLLINKVYDREKGEINLALLRGITKVPQRVVFEILSPLGFNSEQCDSITAIENGTGFRKFETRQHSVTASHEIAQVISTNRSVGFRIETISPRQFKILLKLKSSDSLFMDADEFDKINSLENLEFRPVKPGDRMKPFGMKGRSRLISDILTDAHASPQDKQEARVVLDSHDNILWLAPYRTSIHYPVTEKTERIYRITLDIT